MCSSVGIRGNDPSVTSNNDLDNFGAKKLWAAVTYFPTLVEIDWKATIYLGTRFTRFLRGDTRSHHKGKTPKLRK